MKVSKKELKNLFDKFNKLYFEGKLGKCEILYAKSYDSIDGKYDVRIGRNGEKKRTITLKAFNNIEISDIEKTLIHEMIHMYIDEIEHNKDYGIFGHGKSFQRHCKRLKEQKKIR